MQWIQTLLIKTSPKVAAWLTFLFCAWLLLFALVLEYFVELTPCPLCIAQRIFFLLIGVSAVVYSLFPRRLSMRWFGVEIVSLSLLGGGIAARQVWMQHNPPQVDSLGCPVSFGSFVDRFLQALGGTGDCAKVDWTFLSLSIAEWSLLSFIFLLVVGGWFWWRGRSQA